MKMKIIVIGLLAILNKCLDIPNCSAPSFPILEFTYINSTADATTKASICHDSSFLYVNWTSIDKEVISTYSKCNDPLYNQDAVEIFISTIDSYPNNYYELEVSPKSQLFFADITNPKGTCSSLSTLYFPCNYAEYRGEITPKGWNAFLKIKLEIIGRGKVQSQYKVNLFRIDKSSKDPTRYLTWQPTFANPPCFHVPKYFQEIRLI